MKNQKLESPKKRVKFFPNLEEVKVENDVRIAEEWIDNFLPFDAKFDEISDWCVDAMDQSGHDVFRSPPKLKKEIEG